MPTKKTIKTVGIITKHKIDEHQKTLKDLVRFLKRNKKEIVFDTNSARVLGKDDGLKKTELLKKIDFAIVLGGDGTLLKTARRMPRKRVSILGVNFGNLGFLTECTPDKMHKCLKEVFKDKYEEDRRSILRVTIYRKKQKIDTFLALNDAVINQGAFARLIKMNLEIDRRMFKHLERKAKSMEVPRKSQEGSTLVDFLGGALDSEDTKALMQELGGISDDDLDLL